MTNSQIIRIRQQSSVSNVIDEETEENNNERIDNSLDNSNDNNIKIEDIQGVELVKNV